MTEDSAEPKLNPTEDLALGAFRLVKEKLQFELDFTPETLPVLDHYLRGLKDEGALSEQLVTVVAPCVGAYYGEVVRRALGGLSWHCPEDQYEAWRLEADRVHLRFNPIGVALEALYGEPVAEYGAHLALREQDRTPVARSLEASGGVREDDFYRLAIRYEVLEQTLAVLESISGKEPVH